EKTATVIGRSGETPQATPPPDAVDQDAAASGVVADSAGMGGQLDTNAANEADSAPARSGHGRNGADAYGAAERIDSPPPALTAGDPCPACGRGTVYENPPGVLVRITGHPPLAATIYQLQKLRCHLCGQVFTAPAPAEVASEKYDASAGS